MQQKLRNLEIEDFSLDPQEQVVNLQLKMQEGVVTVWAEVSLQFPTPEAARMCYEEFKLWRGDKIDLIEVDSRLGGGWRLFNISNGGHYWPVFSEKLQQPC